MSDTDLTRLAAELSASGAEPIIDPEGTALTLRQAVSSVFGKVRTILRLDGDRPRDPRAGDDLYGHVLNTRAEGLITQALVAEIVTKINNPNYQMRDVQAIRDAVKRSLR